MTQHFNILIMLMLNSNQDMLISSIIVKILTTEESIQSGADLKLLLHPKNNPVGSKPHKGSIFV